MEHDVDDPVPPPSRYNQYYYVWLVTLPSNLFWLVIYLLSFVYLAPLLKLGG